MLTFDVSKCFVPPSQIFLQLARMHQGEFVAAVWISFLSYTQGYQLPPFCSLHGHHHIHSLRWRSKLALTAPSHPEEACHK